MRAPLSPPNVPTQAALTAAGIAGTNHPILAAHLYPTLDALVDRFTTQDMPRAAVLQFVAFIVATDGRFGALAPMLSDVKVQRPVTPTQNLPF